MLNLPFPPYFQALDCSAPVEIRRRNLPHWRQHGATYAVTCRLDDALPPPIIDALKQRREAMYIAGEDEARIVAEIARETEDHLERAYGACWFANAEFARLVTATFHHFHGTRYFVGAYCVMANHYHIVVTPFGGQSLGDIICSWNKFSSTQLRKRVAVTNRLWDDEPYDSIPRDLQHLHDIVQYIGRNPWKAGLPQDRWIRWVAPEWEALGWGFYDDPNRGAYIPCR